MAASLVKRVSAAAERAQQTRAAPEPEITLPPLRGRDENHCVKSGDSPTLINKILRPGIGRTDLNSITIKKNKQKSKM